MPKYTIEVSTEQLNEFAASHGYQAMKFDLEQRKSIANTQSKEDFFMSKLQAFCAAPMKNKILQEAMAAAKLSVKSNIDAVSASISKGEVK